MINSSSTTFYALLCLGGLLIGSFLSVVVYRLPQMMQNKSQQECSLILGLGNEVSVNSKFNLLLPRSHCPHCLQTLTILETIPLVSFFLIKGKCRYCKKEIGWRYPLLEFMSAILVVIVAFHFGVSWRTFFALIFTWGLLTLAVIDWEKGLLPDQITIPLLWLGLLVNLGNWFCQCEAAIMGAIIGYSSFWFLAWVFFRITKKIGMGHGDFKLLAMLGAWCGWQLLPLIILLASLFGSLIASSLIIFKKQHRQNPIAFGPYLALGGWLALLYGEKWLQWYSS